MPRVLGVVLLTAAAALGLHAYERSPAPTIVPAHVSPSAPTAVARGRFVYERYGCRLCHGENGEGGLANPNALNHGKVPSIAIDFAAEGYSVAELQRLILNGVARIDREDQNGPVPPYRMPGWKGQITDRELDDLIHYLLGLHSAAAKKTR
jgi:mono/diheme cytochrome c family protein